MVLNYSSVDGLFQTCMFFVMHVWVKYVWVMHVFVMHVGLCIAPGGQRLVNIICRCGQMIMAVA